MGPWAEWGGLVRERGGEGKVGKGKGGVESVGGARSEFQGNALLKREEDDGVGAAGAAVQALQVRVLSVCVCVCVCACVCVCVCVCVCNCVPVLCLCACQLYMLRTNHTY